MVSSYFKKDFALVMQNSFVASVAVFLVFNILASNGFGADRVGEIDSSEIDKIERRIKTKSYSTLGIGPFYQLSSQDDVDENHDVAHSIHFGHIWETTPHAAIKIGLESSYNFAAPKSLFLMGGVGARFFFTPSSISPFVEADFGYGFSDGKEVDTTSGFAGGAGIGLALFRTSSTQLQISCRYATLFSKNDEGLPGHYGLVVGINY